MTKTNEELYKLVMDFLINSKHGSDEETLILATEIQSLSLDEIIFVLGVMSGFICGILDLSLASHLTEPVFKEFLNQRYLTMKKEGLFD